MLNFRSHACLWISTSLMVVSFGLYSPIAQAEPAGNCSKTGGVCYFKNYGKRTICTINPSTYCVEDVAKNKVTTCGEFWKQCVSSGSSDRK